MKITAHFDSPDSADFAAGALKNALSPLTAIQTKDYPPKSSDDNSMNIFTVFNPSVTSPTYSMPMYNPSFYGRSDSGERSLVGSDHILEVVCRNEDAAAASKIIISHGGRNITKL